MTYVGHLHTTDANILSYYTEQLSLFTFIKYKCPPIVTTEQNTVSNHSSTTETVRRMKL